MTRIKSDGFTLIEIIMVMVIIGILAALVIPRFIDLRDAARNAKNEANLGALRSAALAYYTKTSLDQYEYLCTAGTNPYRTVTVPSPCYPATYQELESQLMQSLDWAGGTGGTCYDSGSGMVSSCQ